MSNRKRYIIGAAIAVVAALVVWGVWVKWFGTTRVAFVNYQIITLGEISKANDNRWITLHELSTDDIDDIGKYDMVFINAMGLRITEEQRATVQQAADRGTPILTIAATNPANSINSLDSLRLDSLRQYVINGGRRNYRSMLNYVRKEIDRKVIGIGEINEVVPQSNDMLYHKDPKHPDDEELGFNSVAEYDAFLKANGLWKDGAPRIVVTGLMGEPTDLIAKLEETGNVVYGVRSMSKFVKQHHIDSVCPSAVINMAHGRMGDYMVEYLKERNIPLFAPLNVNRLVSEWEEDKMGMQGGFLSQSVVTPEIDGAIRPYVLFGHYMDDEGLQHAYAIPERLECFVQTVNNYLSLQRKSNSEKRVAIYYYKGPGQSALTAAGMEVVPSLYNMLARMRDEGYDVSGLPSTADGLGRMLQAQGSVFGTYAEGAFDDFMQQGKPELVSGEQWDAWSAKALTDDMRREVTELYGEFPGSYMSTADGQLGIARVQLGNIVLIPQTMAGTGTDAFKIVHGTDAAPPYTYIASYLWAQYGFEADAMIHFGTHGSLEFTPRKQAALGNSDWPDALVGAVPHFYIYSIGDVGEGVIAKRRSYAGLQSHITPPFMESALRDTYKELTEAIRRYNALTEGGNETQMAKASLEVKRLTVKMGIHRSLGLDSVLTVPYTSDDIQRIESFGEEVANEKITGQLYTMGMPYDRARITSSVYAMATDPIAYSLLALDKLRGKADPQTEKHKTLFTQRYLTPARNIVAQLIDNPAKVTDAYVCRVAGITPGQLAEAHAIDKAKSAPQNMMAMMMSLAEEAPAEAKTHADIASQAQGAKDTHAPASDMPQTERREGADDNTGATPARPDSSGGPARQPGDNPDSRPSGPPAGHPGMGMMPEAMRNMMRERAKNMSPEEAMAMAKKMGADDEALKRMEAAMRQGDSTRHDAPADTAAPKGHPGGMPPKGKDNAPAARPGDKPAMAGGKTAPGSNDAPSSSGGMAAMMKKMMGGGKEYTKDEVAMARAILEVERTLKNVGNYKQLLISSPENELSSLMNALNGGYTAPSPGGDPIANPNTLPTGRNLFAINAEETPTEEAWEKGKLLAENTIDMYRRRHNDSLPRKVSYTLWSGEFIESGGATIAQVLYMLGVEPIRDTFGRVTDLRLIPSDQLGRPRIDVVVQTSGQLRDIAASRLFLINRAVEMAAEAKDDKYTNQVAEGIVEAERVLTERGLSPKEAREVSTYRVFGGLNGGYGTGIQAMVNAGDRWDTEQEIADVYMNNMGAFYGTEKDWETVKQYAFEAALTRTDAVIQPRQSNTWGALSLDHVYEFMGGMNLAVRNVTGKDPDAYLSDYRNRNNVRMQEVKEALGVESQTTLFNPAYIKEKMKGGATSANTFSELVQNTYGWNVMKPEAIDNEMWDEIYDVYVKDKHNLGVQQFFEQQSPAALQEMTAVMMESARKGMWKATDRQLADIAALHTELVNKYKPACSGFVCDNAKLRQFIADKADARAAADYKQNIDKVREASADKKGVVMKKEELAADSTSVTNIVSNTVVIAVVVIAVIILILLVRQRRKRMRNEE